MNQEIKDLQLYIFYQTADRSKATYLDEVDPNDYFNMSDIIYLLGEIIGTANVNMFDTIDRRSKKLVKISFKHKPIWHELMPNKRPTVKNTKEFITKLAHLREQAVDTAIKFDLL